jgi:hypothetical protein
MNGEKLKMKIKYKNEISDIEAYGKLLYAKSPTVKQHLKKAWLTAVVLILIFGLVLYVFNEELNILLFWSLLSIGWLIYIPFQHKKRYIKNMVKTYKEEEHRKFFELHSLTIDDSGLTDQIEAGINHTEWNKIEHIETTESYTFIFIGSAMSHAICKDRILEGDCDSFLNLLKSKLDENKKKGDTDENRRP